MAEKERETGGIRACLNLEKITRLSGEWKMDSQLKEATYF